MTAISSPPSSLHLSDGDWKKLLFFVYYMTGILHCFDVFNMKEIPLIEKVCPNFWPVLFII